MNAHVSTDLLGQTTTIKAVSLWQPWGSLIAAGVKRNETRHWPTDYRGLIAICAAKRLDTAGAPEGLCRDALGPRWASEVPLGQVLAIARLVACRQTSQVRCGLTRADHAAGNFETGRYAWKLADIRPLITPIPVIGRQGLFNWAAPDDLESRLGPVLNHEDCCRRMGWL